MNCQEFWNHLPQRGTELTQPQADHLAVCPACAAQWEPHRALAAGLQSLAEECRQVEAPARVQAGLTAAFRAQASFQRRRHTGPSWWTPVFAWTSAAAAMIALAVILVRGGQPERTTPDTFATPPRSTQVSPETARAKMPASGYTEADEDSAVLGDGFVRLPNAARIEANEDYNVVRFEVPGSAMIALGLAVSEDRATETVLADVALGADGTARAVRLVADGGTF